MASGGQSRTSTTPPKTKGESTILFLEAPSADKTRLPDGAFLRNLCRMSAVELAVKKVKKLSAPQARELLCWLDKKQANGKPAKRRRQPWWRRGTARQRMKKLR